MCRLCGEVIARWTSLPTHRAEFHLAWADHRRAGDNRSTTTIHGVAVYSLYDTPGTVNTLSITTVSRLKWRNLVLEQVLGASIHLAGHTMLLLDTLHHTPGIIHRAHQPKLRSSLFNVTCYPCVLWHVRWCRNLGRAGGRPKIWRQIAARWWPAAAPVPRCPALFTLVSWCHGGRSAQCDQQ